MTVLAPMDGTVVALRELPDPVFAQEIVGPGIAIDPLADRADPLADQVDLTRAPVAGGLVAVRAPAAGQISTAFPHALALELGPDRALLVHLGIDTVELAGEGFELHVAVGDQVVAGQLLVTWSPAVVVAGGRSALSPLIAVQGHRGDLQLLAAPGTTIRTGDPLLTWS